MSWVLLCLLPTYLQLLLKHCLSKGQPWKTSQSLMTFQTEGTRTLNEQIQPSAQEFEKSYWLESQKVPNLNSLEPLPKIPMAF